MPDLTIQRIIYPFGFELPAPASMVQDLYFTSSVRGETESTSGLTAILSRRTGRGPLTDETRPQPEPVGRTSVRVPRGSVLCTDTYFNRVHAGYWQRWTELDALTLTVVGSGHARMAVRRSSANGSATTVRVVEGELSEGLSVDVDLAPSAAGGCLWMDIEPIDTEIAIDDARWHTEVDYRHVGLDVAICTYNRPYDVLALLSSLRRDKECLEVVDRVWLVDNGTNHFTDIEGAHSLAAEWGDRLRHILQPNLGGSGGFSRGLYEAAYHGDQPYVMLLDDDVVVEPEGVRRAAVFAALAKSPTVVGGHMLNRAEPRTLHSSAEWVDTNTMRWGPAPGGEEGIDLASERLDSVLDAGYNAWWSCLIPTSAVRKAGLGMPFFIKYDDVEFGYRLLKHGFRTVSLPGFGVWHEPWTLKDDTTDWTLYFHVRNRLVFTALMSAGLPKKVQKRRVNTVVQDVLKRDILANVLRRAYASAASADLAMQDFLRGPEILREPLDECVARIRAFRASYPDAQTDVPTGGRGDTPTTLQRRKGPRLPLGLPRAVLREYGIPVPKVLPIPVQLLVKPSADNWKIWQMPQSDGEPLEIPKAADHWWGLVDTPDAWVATVDGIRVTRRTRTPALSRELTRRALRTSKLVKVQFPGLAEDYAATVADLTSPQTWAKQFRTKAAE